FNQSRNRGFAWIPGDCIEGMIGLIPFQIGGEGENQDANWSCDWILADPARNPGMGILLLKSAIRASPTLFALGGNETTQRLLPRLASRTDAGAGIPLHLVLRSGAILRRIERRFKGPRLPFPQAWYKIPLRRVPRTGAYDKVVIESGVARKIAPLIEAD